MRLPALAARMGGPQASAHPPPHFGESLDPGGKAKSLEARRHARQRSIFNSLIGSRWM